MMTLIVRVIVILITSVACCGAVAMDWPFDQAENVATITTKQVLEDDLPILVVVHYDDDHSWAFVCGTTNESEDLKLVTMKQIVARDASLLSIADLPPGWQAVRESRDSEWVRSKIE